MVFPLFVSSPLKPPLLLQGAKTRLVPFIFSSIKWNKKGVWFEGFLGTGAVLFNAINFGKIKHAIVTDINPYIIEFVKA